MHRARTFFYVAAGIFLLTLAFHLGARSATAQGAGRYILAGTTTVFVCPSGDIWMYFGAGVGWVSKGNPLTNYPGRMIEDVTFGASSIDAVLDNGEVLQSSYPTNANEVLTWSSLGFPGCGAPTPTQQSTWGRVKARYR